MRFYNSVHRQQLFNWIGRHIESRANSGRLDDGLRKEYIECLRSSLEKGLWAKKPDEPDYLGDGSLFYVDRPITCFTEWALGQSQPHTRRYGRMALGFPKRFVLSRGGQPIMYIRDGKQKTPYSLALHAVAKWFKAQIDESPACVELREVNEQFRYLEHFTKRISHPAKTSPQKHRKSSVRKRAEPDIYKKNFGPILHYLEEREWRIVYDKSISQRFRKAEDGAGRPEYYLSFKPGEDLFTVVLPDNKTLRLAFEDSDIRKALYPEHSPQVTVLSLEDIGTF